ncbi:g7657 [Coccomyxa elongata]
MRAFFQASKVCISCSSVELGRRQHLLLSVNLGVLGSQLSGTDDPTTVLNSVLGAYGLPQLPGSGGFKLYDDFDQEYIFEYPRSWVGRSNSLRQGVYVSDFNTADKAVVEVFPEPSSSDLVLEVVRRAVSPGQEIGGDARLILPDERRIKTDARDIDGMRYTYIRFPSETVTRSGYQIRRKNFAVAAAKGGTVYSLVASARSDQYNKAKEELLQRVVASFRVRR